MNTLPINKEGLENLRNEKAKELGYLCYNMAADGVLLNSELQKYISAVNDCFGRFKLSTGGQKQYYASQLDKEAESLGYVYYNLIYVNKKPQNGGLDEICRSISEISGEIVRKQYEDALPPHNRAGENKSIFLGKTNTEEDPPKASENNFGEGFENGFTDDFKETGGNTFADNSESSFGEDMNGLKINCPYGMEPIPVNPKICRCGYRNRSYAKYCGKCGAKL